MSGLTNGTPYTFTVTATNAYGTGPPSGASNSVTPSATPPPFIASNLAGSWNFTSFQTYPGLAWWGTMTPLTIGTDGSVSFTQTQNNGSTSSFTGTLWISPSGIIVADNTGKPFNKLFQVDASNTILVTTNNTSGNGYSELDIGLKAGSSYSGADFNGSRAGNILLSGTNPGTVGYTSATFATTFADSLGDYTGTFTPYGQSSFGISGTESVSEWGDNRYCR